MTTNETLRLVAPESVGAGVRREVCAAALVGEGESKHMAFSLISSIILLLVTVANTSNGMIVASQARIRSRLLQLLVCGLLRRSRLRLLGLPFDAKLQCLCGWTLFRRFFARR